MSMKTVSDVPSERHTVPGPILSPANEDGLSPVAATNLQLTGMLYRDDQYDETFPTTVSLGTAFSSFSSMFFAPHYFPRLS